jgi:hypothetical protein
LNQTLLFLIILLHTACAVIPGNQNILNVFLFLRDLLWMFPPSDRYSPSLIMFFIDVTHLYKVGYNLKEGPGQFSWREQRKEMDYLSQISKSTLQRKYSMASETAFIDRVTGAYFPNIL